MNNYKRYMQNCLGCGGTTTKFYARGNGGLCKRCRTGASTAVRRNPATRSYRRYVESYDNMNDPMYERPDVYETMSYRDVAMNDRLDYANEVARFDPERAAEIRMGA